MSTVSTRCHISNDISRTLYSISDLCVSSPMNRTDAHSLGRHYSDSSPKPTPCADSGRCSGTALYTSHSIPTQPSSPAASESPKTKKMCSLAFSIISSSSSYQASCMERYCGSSERRVRGRLICGTGCCSLWLLCWRTWFSFFGES